MNSKFNIRPYKFNIESFRNFRDVSFELGRKMTIICGQNGVGKSNILSLIASGSGVNKKSIMGSNFQPEFYDFFNIDQSEDFENYKLYLQYMDRNGEIALTKKLSFKDDSADGRGIRVIPRTTNHYNKETTVEKTEKQVKDKFGVGGAARVKIPTIFLSISRLYPLGERRNSVSVKKISKRNTLYQKKADEKFKEWYNRVIPNSIINCATLTRVEKSACSRASLHMDMQNTPTLSQSIGQDNIGNIISALVDIYILSQEADYAGALLCIDEVDVSLHPDTQLSLLDLLDELADELSIQFVVTTHSLTLLKECIKKENRHNLDYKVVYIKNPTAPYVTESKSYELLEADLFGKISFNKPKVKVYFEDCVSEGLFHLLIKSFKEIYKNIIEGNSEDPILRNSTKVENYKQINKELKNLKDIITIEDNINTIPTKLGCEELLQIEKADTYFERVIFVLDGDSRYKESDQKPKIRDFLTKKYNPNELGLNERDHKKNICFLPGYFAPESYLYGILYKIYSNASENALFWRKLDQSEETFLYTSDKIRQQFSNLTGEYTNDNIKGIFKDFDSESEIWNFIKKSGIITYYYSDYETIDELLDFIIKFYDAYKMVYPKMISNRYT